MIWDKTFCGFYNDELVRQITGKSGFTKSRGNGANWEKKYVDIKSKYIYNFGPKIQFDLS